MNHLQTVDRHAISSLISLKIKMSSAAFEICVFGDNELATRTKCFLASNPACHLQPVFSMFRHLVV